MNRNYMAQLDGLRAVAVAAVFVHHAFPGGSGYPAVVGVRLFFVLSGFLITGILLRYRDNIETGPDTRGRVLKIFYARRFLRIFPLYYLVVFVALLAGMKSARGSVWWLLSYTLNIKMAAQGWYEAHFAHFWTLSVEEQFYLAWPLLILTTPKKAQWPLAVLAVLTAPAYRLIWVMSNYTSTTGLGTYISTWSSLDSLGAGAVVALLFRSGRTELSIWLRTLGCGLVALVAWKYLLPLGWQARMVLSDTLLSIALAGVVGSAARGLPGVIGAFLESRPLRYLGGISYGLYVYHPFVILGAWRIFPEDLGQRVLLSVVLTVLLSAVSWKYFERPINRLKRHFDVSATEARV